MPPQLLVLGAVLSVQFGQAFGKSLFGLTGPSGVVALRLGFAALVLLAIHRPRLPRSARERRLVVLLGTAIAGMNLSYPAMRELPIGVAITVQLLGPLAVAIATSRRVIDLLLALLAVTGVVLLVLPGTDGGLPVPGLVVAGLSAVAMGSYVLLSKRTGAASPGGGLLALAVSFAALLWIPWGVTHHGSNLLDSRLLALGFGVAMLSAAVPYSLELAALRRLRAGAVGILQSLEPCVAALAGFLVLGEELAGHQLVAVGCVVAAAAGITAASRRAPAGHEQAAPSGRTPRFVPD